MRNPRKLWCAVPAALLATLLVHASARAGDAPVRLTVRLPADAALTIDGYATKQRGAERIFESPPVAPGKTYTYTLVATWSEGGKPKSAERKIRVEAGGSYTVDFLKNGHDKHKHAGGPIEAVNVFGALMRRDGSSWAAIHEKEAVPTGSLVVALPAAKIHAGNGAVLVGMLADVSKKSPVPVLESAVTFHTPKSGDAELTIDRGIVELVNLKKQGDAKVRIHVPGDLWDLTLQGEGARVILVLAARHTPGTVLPLPGIVKKAEAKDAPITDVFVLTTKGRASLNTGEFTYPLTAPPGEAIFHYDSEKGEHGTERIEKLPDGADGPDKAALAIGKMICDRTCKFCDRPVADVLAELSKGKEFADRGVAVVAAGALDDLPRVIDALEDPKHADTRDMAIKVLRAWIGRGPGQARKVFDALTARKYPEPLARTVLQGLVGFSDEQMARPELYDLLIATLGHKSVALRELAHWHLVRLVPGASDVPFDAGAAPEARADGVRRIRALVPEGKLPARPKTAPEKN